MRRAERYAHPPMSSAGADDMNGAPQMSGRVKKTHMRGPPAEGRLGGIVTSNDGYPYPSENES